MDHIVGEILIQIWETIGILWERVVLATKAITSSHFAESHQINYVEGRNVVRTIAQVGLPVAGFPEPKAFHLLAGVTEGCVSVWCAF